MDTEVSAAPEDIGSGVTREWLYDARVVVFTLPDASRAALDTWGGATLEAFAHWNPQQTYLGMYDTSAPQITMTSHLRQWTDRLTKASKHLRGYHTIILPRRPITQLIKTVLANLINRQSPNLRLEFFLLS